MGLLGTLSRKGRTTEEEGCYVQTRFLAEPSGSAGRLGTRVKALTDVARKSSRVHAALRIIVGGGRMMTRIGVSGTSSSTLDAIGFFVSLSLDNAGDWTRDTGCSNVGVRGNSSSTSLPASSTIVIMGRFDPRIPFPANAAIQSAFAGTADTTGGGFCTCFSHAVSWPNDTEASSSSSSEEDAYGVSSDSSSASSATECGGDDGGSGGHHSPFSFSSSSSSSSSSEEESSSPSEEEESSSSSSSEEEEEEEESSSPSEDESKKDDVDDESVDDDSDGRWTGGARLRGARALTCFFGIIFATGGLLLFSSSLPEEPSNSKSILNRENRVCIFGGRAFRSNGEGPLLGRDKVERRSARVGVILGDGAPSCGGNLGHP